MEILVLFGFQASVFTYFYGFFNKTAFGNGFGQIIFNIKRSIFRGGIVMVRKLNKKTPVRYRIEQAA